MESANALLLSYAEQHPKQVFLTDVVTMNEMWASNGFVLPANVICLNGEGVEKRLLLEPEGKAKFQFPAVAPNAILVNLEATDDGAI